MDFCNVAIFPGVTDGARGSSSCTLHAPAPASPLWDRGIFFELTDYQTVPFSIDTTVLVDRRRALVHRPIVDQSLRG